MKLSELTYEYLQSIGLSRAHIHTDCSDALRLFNNQYQFESAKQDLFGRYGDVDLIITPDAEWYNRIQIDNEKWREDHEAFCTEKAAWCAKYGAD